MLKIESDFRNFFSKDKPGEVVQQLLHCWPKRRGAPDDPLAFRIEQQP